MSDPHGQNEPEKVPRERIVGRRDMLKSVFGAAVFGTGFAGLANSAFARDDLMRVTLAARDVGFSPPEDQDPECTALDIYKDGVGHNGDCQVWGCRPAGEGGQFICATSSGSKFDCTQTFNCPAFTCGYGDFDEDCDPNQFTCVETEGFNCLGSYN